MTILRKVMAVVFLTSALLLTTALSYQVVYAADILVKNNSSDQVWVSYALFYYTDGIGNGDGTIEGGFTVNPGQTRNIFQSSAGVRSVWLNVWRGNKQIQIPGADIFTVGRKDAIRITRGVQSSNPDKLRFMVAVPELVKLANSSYMLSGNDHAEDMAGNVVTKLPRFQVSFPPYTTESQHTLLKSIRTNGDHIFFRTNLPRNGGAFSVDDSLPIVTPYSTNGGSSAPGGSGAQQKSGQNGVWRVNIPKTASDKISELHSAGKNIKHIAFAPNNAWVILFGRNGWSARGISEEAQNKLHELNQAGVEIKSFAFSPTNGWVVFWDYNKAWARGIPQPAFERIIALQNDDRQLKQIAFTAAGGYVILYDKKGAAWSNIPQSAMDKLNELYDADVEFKQFAFTANDGWAVFFNYNGAWVKGVPQATLDEIVKLQKNGNELKHIAFSYDGGSLTVYR